MLLLIGHWGGMDLFISFGVGVVIVDIVRGKVGLLGELEEGWDVLLNGAENTNN